MLSQNLSKICPKICQKFVSGCQKFGKGSGEDEDEEEDWWLLDQVATLSQLVKIAGLSEHPGVSLETI
jgi:hypothetical protein